MESSKYELLKQIKEGRAEVDNEYLRSVRKDGNPEALKEIFDVFECGCIWMNKDRYEQWII
jgi:hydrogenase maturation factor